jgi:hypothetical protein
MERWLKNAPSLPMQRLLARNNAVAYQFPQNHRAEITTEASLLNDQHLFDQLRAGNQKGRLMQ